MNVGGDVYITDILEIKTAANFLKTQLIYKKKGLFSLQCHSNGIKNRLNIKE